MREINGDNLPAVECPRCGYDQRGVIATWTDTCPLEATCTECGLTYRCADLLVPEKFEPPWCVEHCPRGMRSFLRACVATLGRSFLPWRFWSRMKMSDRMRPRRLALYLGVLFLSAYLVPRVLQPLAQQWMAAVQTFHVVQASIDDEIAGFQRQIEMLRDRPAIAPHLLRGFPAQEQQRITRDAERDRDAAIASLQAKVDSPPVLEHSLPMAVLEAIFLPLAESSFGQIRHRDGTIAPYPAPFDIWMKRPGDVPWWSLAPEMYRHGPNTRQGLAIGILVYLIFPLTLALLPISRRKAKVRWAHIWRAAAYGAFIPLFAALAATVLLIFAWSDFGRAGMVTLHMFAAMWLIPIAIIIWWTFAISRYMKMPHGFWVAMLHTYVSIGVALALSWMCWPSLLFAL